MGGTMAVKSPARPQNDSEVIRRAADKYDVPYEILWGMYGIESDYGRNLGPSSAGAKGPFQFLDSTARMYGVNVRSLDSSANGAARYLRDLLKQKGDWDGAIRAYSGGGYGLSEVSKKYNSNKGSAAKTGLFSDFPSPGDIVGSVTGNITDPVAAPLQAIADAVTAVVDFLIHPRRLIKIIIGGVLLLWGINQLAKNLAGVNPARGAKRVAKTAVTKKPVKGK